MRITLGLIVIAACGKSSPSDGPESFAAASEPTPVAQSPADADADMTSAAAVVKPAPAVEEPKPDPLLKLPAVTVTPLSLNPVSAEAKKKSTQGNAAGLRLHRKGKYTDAEAQYTAALVADPSNLLARYNLSCVYNLTGRSEQGLALLLEIAKSGCAACRSRVLRAQWDDDWQSHWINPLLWAILEKAPPAAESDQMEPVCPKGTKEKGTPDEDEVDSFDVWCAKPNGVKHGPSYRTGIVEGSGVHPVHEAFEGSYRNGKKHGLWQEGDSEFVGHYLNNLRHGHWVHVYQIDDDLVDRHIAYVAGILHGRELVTTYFSEPGIVVESAWNKGKQQGPYKSWTVEGQKDKRGAHKDGARHGEWTTWDEEGHKLLRANYDRGVPHGQFEYWDAEGKSIARFEMKSGTGDWVEYDEERAVIEQGKLDQGKRQGPWIEVGKYMKEAGAYEKGTRTGPWVAHHKNGKKYSQYSQGSYLRGKESGPWEYWDPDGSLVAAGTYVAGQPDGKWVVGDGEDGQETLFRRGSLLRVDGERASKEARLGWDHVREDFPVHIYEMTQDEIDDEY